MGIYLSSAVLQMPTHMHSGAKLVLAELALYADDYEDITPLGSPKGRTGANIRPSIKNLSGALGCQRSQVTRSIKYLVDRGWIRSISNKREERLPGVNASTSSSGGRPPIQYEMNLEMLARCLDVRASAAVNGIDWEDKLYAQMITVAETAQEDDWVLRSWFRGYQPRILKWEDHDDFTIDLWSQELSGYVSHPMCRSANDMISQGEMTKEWSQRQDIIIQYQSLDDEMTRSMSDEYSRQKRRGQKRSSDIEDSLPQISGISFTSSNIIPDIPDYYETEEELTEDDRENDIFTEDVEDTDDISNYQLNDDLSVDSEELVHGPVTEQENVLDDDDIDPFDDEEATEITTRESSDEMMAPSIRDAMSWVSLA